MSIREELESQSDRIDAVLARHKVPARVSGGTVTPRWVCFQVLPTARGEVSIKRLRRELATALEVPITDCRVSQRGVAAEIEIPRDGQPVQLLPLLRQLESEKGIPPMTATLGLAEDGAPLLIKLPSPNVTHILVVGTAGSGKTTLLQTMVLSLTITNTPKVLQLVLIDPKGNAFNRFEELPHLARPIITEAGETTEFLSSLMRLVETRMGKQSSPCSPVAVFIDELTEVMGEELVQLTQRGGRVGVHIIAATSEPAVLLTHLAEATFPVRLIGKVNSPDEARVATGWFGTGAEGLIREGDFLALAEGKVTRFQTCAPPVLPDEVQAAISIDVTTRADGLRTSVSLKR